MWKKYGVRVSKKGRICFEDLCDKIINIDKDEVIDLVDDSEKFFIQNRLYISFDSVLVVLLSEYNARVFNFLFKNINVLVENCTEFIVSEQKKNVI